ncbi:MAG TPA: hypothetical protein VFE44_05270, partial [Thermoanaerobaculia bacterium]|nr:hypothetical protein [Thermoanaerobaculia bacterium]
MALAALGLFAIRRARLAGGGSAATERAPVADGQEARTAAETDPAEGRRLDGINAAEGQPPGANPAEGRLLDGIKSRLGDGLIVWESNRSGAWRIWSSRLDGSELRQLSPEDSRQHCCPHLSPDGKLVAYLNLPRDIETYTRNPEEAELRLIGSDGRGERVAAPRAQTYGRGNRAAIW